MKTVFASLFSLLLIGSTAMAADNSDPSVVPSVDLARYAGAWFDIAHNPNFFQKDCVRSTAGYAVISASALSVHG